jgi:phenolic acid decarboxylase
LALSAEEVVHGEVVFWPSVLVIRPKIIKLLHQRDYLVLHIAFLSILNTYPYPINDLILQIYVLIHRDL